MKKLPLTILFTLFFTQILWATPIEFTGGVYNKIEYKEVVFLSGEPIVFKGIVKIDEKEKGESKETKYTFTLTPEDRNIPGRLSRSVTLKTEYAPYNDKGQTIANTEVTRYTETVTIDGDNYRLTAGNVQFSQSDIIDNRPAIDFYDGNIEIFKYYTINNNEGTAQVKMTGKNVGYKNFWGNTETQSLDYVYTIDRIGEGEEVNNLSWEGTVNVQVSDSTMKVLKYSQNQASMTTFNGGYIKTTTQEMVSKYTYNLPKKVDEGFDSYKRTQNTMTLQASMLPMVERLPVPKFRDIGGYWAQRDIEKLYSLGVFDGSQTFFSPNTAMSRIDFVKAIVKSCDIKVQEEETKKRGGRNKKEVEEVIFLDVRSSDLNFPYVKEAYYRNIISGTDDYKFNPNGTITKGEAITILMRTLGFESMAPTPGYKTSFSDDGKIPNWARDAIYMASEIGIIGGDENNNINAQDKMKRGEASAIINRFLEFLQKDLQKSYREDIIYFN
ncbi:MAG: S-layer homology domain-containing protein [Epulopiscium sp.]|nr:S-layer homology domain-containing protein [Candidatus Epulonipiscium sp.]